MVSKDDYIKYCYNADVPIRRAEREILDAITGRMGLFNVERYLYECDKAKIFVTRHQMEILKWLPEDNDNEANAMCKQSKLMQLTKQIKMQNKCGI